MPQDQSTLPEIVQGEEALSAREERLEWLRERQLGIGGSDVATILGVSPWMSTFELYRSKITPVEDMLAEEEEDFAEYDQRMERMKWGQLLESVVMDEFLRRNDLDSTCLSRSITIADPVHTFLRGNLDGLLILPDGIRAVVEIKTTSEWAKGNWGESGTDDVPNHVLVQVHHYMRLADAQYAFVVVLIGGQEYREYRIDRNREMDEKIVKRCTAFWNDYIVPQIEPPRDFENVLDQEYIKKSYYPDGSTCELSDDDWDAHVRYVECNAEIRNMNKEKAKLRAQIQDAVGNCSMGYFPEGGGYVYELKDVAETTKVTPAKTTKTFKFKKKL